MSELHLPWLAILVILPMAGATAVLVHRAAAHRIGVVTSLLTLPLAIGAWIDLGERTAAADGWIRVLFIDSLSAPLLLGTAIMVTAVVITTPKARRGPMLAARFLVAEGILCLTFCSNHPCLLAALFIAGTIQPGTEARSRIYNAYMGAAAVLIVFGVALAPSTWGYLFLVGAIFIRKGIVPLHSWMPAYFQSARLGTIVIFSMPQVGTYCAARLIVPSAPPVILNVMGIAALVTAVYAAWLGLVQKDARRMFGFFFMSQSAVVLAGLGCDNVAGLAGGLTLWVSSIISLTGLGVTLRALEARRGTFSLAQFHGGYDRMPILASSFLILGLASVGIPGTLGFVAEEMLVHGAVRTFPAFGFLVAGAAALNGITVLRSYASLFCGVPSSPRHEYLRPRERLAVLALVVLLLAGGILPSQVVRREASAASQLLSGRPDQSRRHDNSDPPR